MPEMPGRADRLSSLDDRGRSVGDGNTQTKPDVTVGDDKQPSTNRTALDRVNEELGKHEPGSPAYNTLKERGGTLSDEEQPSTSDAEIRNEYGNAPTDDTANSSIRETDNLGDFTPELKEAQLRSAYSDDSTPSETSGSPPGDSNEISDGGGGDSGGDVGGGGGDGGGDGI
ncbi:MAG: hypothetical protein ACBR15_08065 [Microcoleus sp.]